jgi:hypothetical protein
MLKSFPFLSLFVCCSFCAFSQTFQFNYQAITRDAQTAEPYRDKKLGVQVSILDQALNAKYTDKQFVSTSSLGVFSIRVGAGDVFPTGMTLDDIAWANGPYRKLLPAN